MRRRVEEVRQELELEISRAIEELVAWERERGTANLSEMEEKVLAIRQRLGQGMLAAVIADQEARQPAEPPRCEHCGAEMRYKGQKETTIESLVGEVKVERGYYYCARCESGFFPPERPTAGG